MKSMKRRNKIYNKIILLLILLLVGTAFSWAQTASKWDGTNPTTTWSAANVTAAGITGSGTEANPYVIHDATGFVYFWWAANNGSLSSNTQYWKLGADIDLDNHTWPHVNLNKTFKGKFDGQNHTISNMKLEPATANYNYGLFCMVEGQATDNRAEVKNLIIDKATVAPSAALSKTTSVGIVIGKSSKNADITNVKVTNSTITYANNISDANYVGGIVGQTLSDTKLTGCSVSKLTITASGTTTNAHFGGMIGYIGSQTDVSSCSTSEVSITYNAIANASRLSGFIGYAKGAATVPVNITGCTVTKTNVTLKAGINNASYIGAFVAQTGGNVQITTDNKVDSPVIDVAGSIAAASYIGGAVGQLVGAADNPTTTVDGMTVTSPSVTVNKNAVANSCFGATFGHISTYSAVTSITVSDPTMTYKATDNPNFALNLGSFAGYIVGNATQEVTVTDIDITGDAKVVLGTGSTSNLSNIRAGLVGYANANVRLEDWTVKNTEVQVKGNLTTATSYLGGVVGYTTTGTDTPITLKNITITDSSKITVGGSVDISSFVGGAVGYLYVSSATYSPISASNISITGLDISFDGNFTNTLYVGGITGMLKAQTTANTIEQCSASGKIRSVGSHTFKENLTYAFGGIVGYTDQSATAKSEIKQCTSKVDFDLSGFTPVNVSGSNYNLYRSAFIVGGVVGRLHNPSCLPEHVYYSGKIYAPFAAVAPIVGVFYTANNSAAYPYNEYSGENAANVTAEEWKKTDSWYYNGYKLGLSSEVISQTARTKNYKTPPVVDNGVSYLTVDDKTFDRPNEISGAVKNSYTVLAYTANNTDKDMGIFPQWNTNTATYPAYYMYYMQGLNRGKYVPDDEVDFVKTLMASGITFYPTLTRTGDDEHGYVFTVDPGDAEVTDGFTLTYQWYQSDKTTPITGETGKALSISKDDLEAIGNTVFCVVTVSGTGFTSVSRTLRGMYTIVVFVNGNNYAGHGAKPGLDTNDGMTPQTPVKTIDKANSLLDGGPWEKNTIVVMGRLSSGIAEENCFKSRGTNPATLTGKWDGIDYEGEINLVKGAESNANPGDGPGKTGLHNYVSADTKFEYLILRAAHDVDNMFLELHGHDVWLGKGLRMQGFRDLSAGHGNLTEDTQTIPEFSIILTSTNPAHPDEAYWTRTKPQVLTIESGHYGRILGGRYVSGFFTNGGNTSHSILATAKHPAWAVINIDIDPGNDMKSADGKKTYTCDVNCIVAGLTDGSIYGDYQINIHGGNVRYAVGANQGNSVVSGDKTYTPIGGTSGKWGQWPNASFFGRTIINVEQKDGLKPITLNNLYAGGLGRNADANSSANTVVDMYVYGHTEINMKSGNVSKNVYGGGAGGVIGINPWDAHIPYATNDADNASSAIFNGVQYGDNRVTGAWSTKNVSDPLVNVVLHKIDEDGNFTPETEMLNLANSSTTLNITGGNIGGNVFGGGNGYVSNMPILGTMQGVGSVFGTSNVNISGGTISGSVYGGSEGNSGYYGKVNKHGQKITHIAEMNGTVNINITGASTHIGGNIYGAGQGIASTSTQEYVDIATAGNADLGEEYKTNINVLIDLPDSNPFNGNIYGGGQMGAVDGNTKVVIKSGIINGDVFGGGKGEDGHPNKAKVTGGTNVIVDSGWEETPEPTPEPEPTP